MMVRIGALISGQGTNLQSVIDACETGKINGKVVVVLSNKKEAYGLVRAKDHNIPAFFVSPKNKKDEEYDQELTSILESYNVDIVILAGYLKILTPVFIKKYQYRILNIHPALLPSFGGKGYYGLHVHEAVINEGCKVSGCTVHFVTEEVDHGPIIVQKSVHVLDTDTPETLAERILPMEHESLVEAIKKITENKYKIQGNRVIFE